MDALLKQVLRKVTPSEKEQRETKEVIQKVMEVTNQVIEPMGLSKILVGSFTRDTWMPHKKEFDVFILFPEEASREELEKKGLEVGRQIVSKLKGSYKIAYAEHPYTRAKISGYDVDIVPCYNVQSASKIKSAVDRTPFHNRWLAKNFQQNLSGEVRLLKQFCKALGIYGSDTKTLGLSGYLCELLILHYGSFKNFVNQAAKWEAGRIVIDIRDKRVELDKELWKKFERQPLIVIDPVDSNRNVAAAFSPENFSRLVHACREFAKKPSMRFFFRPETRPNLKSLEKFLRARRTYLIAIKFRKPDVIDDILWPQLRKTARRLNDILEENEFKPLGFDVFANGDCIIFFEMEVWLLPPVKKIRGPEIFAKKRAEEFLKKYKPLGRVWVENEYWVAEVKRPHLGAKEKLASSLSEKKNILLQKGIASYIAENIAKGFIIYEDKKALALAKANKEFFEFLKNYFEKKMV